MAAGPGTGPWRSATDASPFLKDQGFAAETFGDLAPYGNAGFLDAVLTLMAAAGLGRALPVATTRERPALAT